MIYDYLLKIIFVGDSGVGKTNILHKYTDITSHSQYKPTIGVEFYTNTLSLNGKNIKIQIWDTSGSGRYKSITNTYYRGANAVIMVYDITKPTTFTNIINWINDIDSIIPNTIKILVGNKSDLRSYRMVSTLEGESFAKNHGFHSFLETSAIDGENITTIFETICETYHDNTINSTLQLSIVETDNVQSISLVVNNDDNKNRLRKINKRCRL
jgi:small GTP-binding protein